MTYKYPKWGAVASAFVLACLFLVWAPTAYGKSILVGTLLIFGAMALLGTALLLAAKGDQQVKRGQNFAWGVGALTVALYVGLLCAGRTVGVGSYRSGWAWDDGVGLALAAIYLLSYVLSLRAGGAPAPAYPEADYRSVWQAQQESDRGAVTGYQADHRR